MTTAQRFILAHDIARSRAARAIEQAPAGYVVEVKEPTRNGDQNAKLHAMLADIARQVTHAGQKLPVGVWKRLAVAAYMREQGEAPLMVPALDGIGIDVIYERTSQMSKRTMAGLIEWLYAFGAEKGVVWSEPAEVPA
jgi:hypothetical protein